MGQRANYVLVEDDGYALFYSHWGATSVPRDLFWGPERAIPFFRAQRPCEEDGWLDDRWGEGGALVDPRQRVLILFGGEDLAWEAPLRRVYLELLAVPWAGWEIRWAHEGLRDLGRHVGVPSERFAMPDEPRDFPAPPTRCDDWVRTVCTLDRGDGTVVACPMQWDSGDLLRYGPALVDVLAGLRADSPFEAPPDVQGGIHLDPARRSLDFWCANASPGILDLTGRWWRDWAVAVAWHHDRFEEHERLCGGALRFLRPPAEELLERVKAILLFEHTRNLGEAAAEIAVLLGEHEGKKVEVNPNALRHDPQEVPRAERERIVAEAVAAVQRGARRS